ncbi:MAG: hypothetical protein AAF152_20645 [Cyanobacteria bacterium P01_A01_bin.114]
MNRKFWGAVLILGLLTGCQSQVGEPVEPIEPPTAENDEAVSTAPQGNATNCPASDTNLSLRIPKDGLVFEQFNFRPDGVEATADTVTFENNLYRFVFCRGDRSWAVLKGEASEEAPIADGDYEAFLSKLENPDYETIELADANYKARVRLEAEWLSEQSEGGAPPAAPPEEKVVFELIEPGETEPTAKVLYTAADLVKPEFGGQLGVPRISQALSYQDALWWAVAFEQGEGNTGITTIVQYQPESDEVRLWQPKDLNEVQITDMAMTGEGDELTLWLGTQLSGEGNPDIPARGLVAYRPNQEAIKTYSVHNSPLIGAIPHRLLSLEDTLWVGTGNGACEIQWQTLESADSWDCWKFIAVADLPEGGISLYKSLLAEESATQLTRDTVEVLWASDTELEEATGKPRYEVRYPEGFEVTLDLGAQRYTEDSLYNYTTPANFSWPGSYWHWNGDHFVRSQDEVSENHFGGGPQGLGPADYTGYINDWYTIRGDLDLLYLSDTETSVRYFSGWVEGDAIEPYLTVVMAEMPEQVQPNPLEPIKQSLEASEPFPQAE